MTVRAAAIAGAVVAAAVAAAVAGRLLRPRPSDEESVRRVFADAARAAEERRVGAVMEGVSERFRGEDLDREGLRRLVAFETLRGEWRSVVILGTKVSVEGARAEATVDVALVRGGSGGDKLVDSLPSEASLKRIDAVLEREGDAWRVVSARYRPLEAADALSGPPP